MQFIFIRKIVFVIFAETLKKKISPLSFLIKFFKFFVVFLFAILSNNVIKTLPRFANIDNKIKVSEKGGANKLRSQTIFLLLSVTKFTFMYLSRSMHALFN